MPLSYWAETGKYQEPDERLIIMQVFPSKARYFLRNIKKNLLIRLLYCDLATSNASILPNTTYDSINIVEQLYCTVLKLKVLGDHI